MSTLGGTRGERNAKPKFAALDINKLYITSRGESLEPSTQKNTAPRKHGMQSLGKVPSARRPANLPSLKAETSSPPDQSWGAENSNATSSVTNISSSTTNTTSSNIQNANTPRFPSSNTSSANVNEIPIQPSSNNQKNLSASSNSSASWSAVAEENPTQKSPLYQSSSQFQNEFPSLDGAGQIGGAIMSNKQDGGLVMTQIYTDGTQINMRQTDAGWIQQQGSNSGRGENTGSQNNQQGPARQELPPQFRALMPPFMYRSGSGFAGNSSPQPSSLLPNFGLPPQSHSQQNYSTNQGNRSSRMQYNDQNYYQGNGGGGQSNRRNQPPPRLSNASNKEQPTDNRQSTPVESEVLVQRPIIREEELERIESIAKDEGWAKHDEIDYNQKLQFSDDEDHMFSTKMSDLEKSPSLEMKKSDDEKRIIGRSWSREVEREVERQEMERLEKEKLENSMEMMELERERQTEMEREMQRPQQNSREHRNKNNPQATNSGGSRNFGTFSIVPYDPETVERLKQRREEEEKKVLERKQAANKKLQELEQKMSRKKTEEKEEDCSSRTSSFNEMFDLKLMAQDSVKSYPRDNERNNNNSSRSDRDRDNNNRYEYNNGKFDRDTTRDSRDMSKEAYAATRDRENRDMPSFSKTFQSNLPPRFQKQQQMERGTTSSPIRHALSGDLICQQNATSPDTAYRHQIQHASYNTNNINNNLNSTNNAANNGRINQNDSKKANVLPFAQQYDPRFIHQQNYNKNQQVANRRPTEDMVRRDKREESRKRMDSEEDDRFSSGRESNSKTPQLVRSISDSSQRKISISSDDYKLNDSNSSGTFLDKSSHKEITSWENEAEIELKNLEKAELSFLSKAHETSNVNSMYVDNADVPKQILQRKKESSLSDEIDRISKTDDDSFRIEKSNSFKHLSESPKIWEDKSNQGNNLAENLNEDLQKSLSNGSINLTMDEKQITEMKVDEKHMENKSSENSEQSADKKEDDINKFSNKKHIGRGGNPRHDSYPRGNSGMSSRGYTAYRGGSWNRRGGPRTTNMSGRNYNQDYYSDSDQASAFRGPTRMPDSDSDEYDDDYNKRGGMNKNMRKDGGTNQYNRHNSNTTQNQKEGFAPRGEPSRRGRGGNSNASGAFRKPIGKRIEGYGPPSSKPFGNNDERIDNKSIKEFKGENSNSEKHKQNSGISASKKQSSTQHMQLQKSGSGSMKPPGKPTEEVMTSQGRTRTDSARSNDEKSKIQDKLPIESIMQKSEEKEMTKNLNDKPKIINEKGFINSISMDNTIDTSNDTKNKKVDQFSQKAQQASSNNTSLARNKNIKDDRRTDFQPNRRNNMLVNKQPLLKPSLSKPNNVNQTNKESDYRDRTVRTNNLPPRLAKQKENRIQRTSENGQQENSGDSSDTTNTIENVSSITNQRSTPTNLLHGGNEKMSTMNNKTDNTKQLLDPPVNTIIFENTNFKSAPQGTAKRQVTTPTSAMIPMTQKQDEQNDEDPFKSSPALNSAIPEIIEASQQNLQKTILVNSTPQSQAAEALTSALQAGMAFQKQESEYEKDMKLFTFETEISQLTDDKNTTKGNLCLPKSVHSVTSVTQNIISPSTADLNMKIASVKKVWEVPVMPTVIEHSADDTHMANFVTQQHLQQYNQSHASMVHNQQHHQLAAAQTYNPTYGQEQAHYNKQNSENMSVGDVENTQPGMRFQETSVLQHACAQHPGNHVQQHQSANLNLKHSADVLASNTNVCKVKPTQQQIHQAGLGLSPPPIQQQGALQSAPQQYYQSQYGNMSSAIPSPPTVLYNSSPMNPFQLDAGRSQFSQFPTHYGTAGNTPYSYMTTPPNLQTAPTPDMYQNFTSQLRMSNVQAPFNQSQQQMNNPSTVLISSTSNSLMSASVKPSSQQIGAIGSKSGTQQLSMPGNTVGQPYGQNTIHGQQYMGMFQQAPPMQNNSFYSSSASGQAPFFGGTAGATQNYGIQAAASMFGGHASTPSNAPACPPPQQQLAANFGSQFLSSPLQLANAINQQYRGCPNTNPQAAYMKSNQPQSHLQDPNGRQLKSPLNNDGLNNLKQMTSQSSPPYHKAYVQSPWEMQNQVMQQQQSQQQQQQTQNRSLMSSNNANLANRPPQVLQNGPQRYPAPIQRPTNNYMQSNPINQQRPNRPPNQPNVQQSINANKHYYANAATRGGGHVNAGNDQNMGKSANEKNIDNPSNDIVKDDIKKE